MSKAPEPPGDWILVNWKTLQERLSTLCIELITDTVEKYIRRVWLTAVITGFALGLFVCQVLLWMHH